MNSVTHFRALLLLILLFSLVATLRAEALHLPVEGISLSQSHVQFEWPELAGVDSYQLWIVEDLGAPDPFDGASPSVDASVDAASPRKVVTSGLDFGKAYAWRVRGHLGSPTAWGPTHRFEIDPLPAEMPSFAITTYAGSIQPGVTLFNLNREVGATYSYVVAVDLTGQVVWFHQRDGVAGDARLLDSGRVLFLTDYALEITLSGQMVWRSPDGIDLHHEAFPMPNGDLLALTNTTEPVTVNSQTRSWQGDLILQFDRDDNSIVWQWDAFDHLSTLDYDVPRYEQTTGQFGWTHGNAVTYDPVEDSVYFSSRHLSRIVRIDYATGQVVYNMGFDMPAGEAAFGDDLFSWQHAQQLLPGDRILLFDNGNRRGHVEQSEETGVSKAVELQLTGDPPTSASIVWEWTVPTYNSGKGDADRLANGNTLVVAGNERTIHEVDSSGNEVWRLEIAMGAATFGLYRGERVDSIIVDLPGDSDGDGVADQEDNCPDHFNAGQEDRDEDHYGDLCADALGLPLPEPQLPLLFAVGCVALAWKRARGEHRRLHPPS